VLLLVLVLVLEEAISHQPSAVSRQLSANPLVLLLLLLLVLVLLLVLELLPPLTPSPHPLQ
jgi:hypothetical protein